MNRIKMFSPLDPICLVSTKENLFNFLEYLFVKAANFNKEMKAEMGEDFFPVCSWNDKSHSFDFEYEFLVENLIEYAAEIYGIDEDEKWYMASVLKTSTDAKIKKARYMFFVVTLGYYHRLCGNYYNDISTNYGMIFIPKIVKNKQGKLARAKVFQIRSFVEEQLSCKEAIEALKTNSVEQVAFGFKSVKKYEREHKTAEIQEIFKLSYGLSEE